MGRIHNTEEPPGRRGRREKGKKKGGRGEPTGEGQVASSQPLRLCTRCQRVETHARTRGAPSSSLPPRVRPARSTRSASCAACRVNLRSPAVLPRLGSGCWHLRPRAATAQLRAIRRRPPLRSSSPSPKNSDPRILKGQSHWPTHPPPAQGTGGGGKMG